MRFGAGPVLMAIVICALPATANVPLYFEANQGQTDAQVIFLARTPKGTVFLTRNGAVFSLDSDAAAVVRMKLLGSSQEVKVEGTGGLEGRSNYFIGSDPNKWTRNVQTYAQVRYKNLYPGIDLLYHGNGRELEYDFSLAPGADPNKIGMSIGSGRGSSLRVDGDGDLVVSANAEEVRFHKPVAYEQDFAMGERRPVSVEYVVSGRDRASFRLGIYDRTKTLIIDPTLTYSTYLGGSDDEGIFGIKFDGQGNIYVAGETSSVNFPTEHPIQPKLGGSYDVFITKFDPTGSRLIYSTYLGGSMYDHCTALAVDAWGSAYVVGLTNSSDFPVAHALQPTLRGGINGFIARLNAAGSELVFSTYWGGSGNYDLIAGLALDSAGNAYVTGLTTSTDFPVTKGAYQTVCDGGANPGQCFSDAFVTKVSASGTKLFYSTYLGGAGGDSANDIAVDRYGSAYVTGETTSGNFPLRNAFQKTLGGRATAFVTKLDPGGCALEFSTYLGGNNIDSGQGIALDKLDQVYVTGRTGSSNFPLANPYQSKFKGKYNNAFVTKLTEDGEKLIYSTYLGGTVNDVPSRIAVDALGSAVVIGFTASTDFPVVDAVQPKYAGGNYDAFVTKFDPAGCSLEFSTYLGGKGDEYGYAVNADQAGSIWIGGSTSSVDYPVVKPFQKYYGGGPFDAFLSKISLSGDH